ncbi:hypothetical protein CPB86DRAFT_800279 [Serendipita vermifera]|nr:hypothetical protein CPB86DRAFT_800279 [Serendipita vermifera]
MKPFPGLFSVGAVSFLLADSAMAGSPPPVELEYSSLNITLGERVRIGIMSDSGMFATYPVVVRHHTPEETGQVTVNSTYAPEQNVGPNDPNCYAGGYGASGGGWTYLPDTVGSYLYESWVIYAYGQGGYQYPGGGKACINQPFTYEIIKIASLQVTVSPNASAPSISSFGASTTTFFPPTMKPLKRALSSKSRQQTNLDTDNGNEGNQTDSSSERSLAKWKARWLGPKSKSSNPRERHISTMPNETEIKAQGIVKISADMTSVAGPLKAACGMTEIVLTKVKVALKNAGAWDQVAEKLKQYLGILQVELEKAQDHINRGNEVPFNQVLTPALGQYLNSLSNIYHQAEKYITEGREDAPKGPVIRAFGAQQEEEMIRDLSTQIDETFHQISHEVSIYIRDTLMATEKAIYKSSILQLLPEVDSHGSRARPLEPGTREALISRLTEWAFKLDPSEQIFWLTDEAGTGKTTLAAHMADKWDSDGILVGRFFFNRDDRTVDSTFNFNLSIARDIATRYPQSHNSIMAVLLNQTSIDTLGFEEQFNLLVLNILHDLQKSVQKPLVMVVDALDECNARARPHLVTAITGTLKSISLAKLLLTSRRGLEVDKMLHDAPNVCGQDACLLDIHSSMRDHDVSVYVGRALASLTHDERQIVIECARGHFLWASLATSALRMSSVPSKLLHNMRKMEPDNTLRQLYEAILENALPDEVSLTLMRYVLQAISLAFQPISIFTIERFSPADPENRSPSYVQIFVDRLASLMKDGTIYLPIHTLHPSFQQFLKDQPPEARFYLEPDRGHARLASACLDLLPTLKAGTWTHFVPLSKITREWEPRPPKVLEEGENMPLRYAVTFWARHVYDALDNPLVCERLLRFFNNDFLVWVEWASAIREIPEGMDALVILRKHIHTLNLLGVFDHLDWQLEKWCNDALNFLQNNQRVIERYPNQVHTSALFFTPTTSFIHRTYFTESHGVVPTVFNKPSIVQSTHRVLMGGVGKSGIRACEFSSDGQRLLTLTTGGRITLWSARDGTEIMDLEDPDCAPGFRCARFSRNGALIVSGGSLDHRVAVWDGVTGKLVRLLPRDHRSAVNQVIFALNDTSIVSTSEDFTMRRWSIADETGSDQFKGATHTRSTQGLAASPDGAFAASWSAESLILWDVQSCFSLQKWVEKGGFAAAVFSLDGKKLIGGDDSGNIHFWDTSTQEKIRIIEAHQGCVYSLAICADRTTLASASLYENSVRLWNIHTGEELCTPLSTHADDVVGLAFSKKGRRLFSASCDRTIRVWNLWQNGKAISTDSFALVGHTDELTLIAVAPEGDKVVSSSSDTTVRLWEVHDDGESNSHVSYLQQDRIERILFSQDGKVILSVFKSGKFQLWDADTGHTVSKVLAHEHGHLCCCDISNQGDIVATGYKEGIAVIWKSSKDSHSSFDLDQHSGAIRCIKFSRENTNLAVGGGDTVAIWNIDQSNLTKSRLIRSINTLVTPGEVDFSPDENYLALFTANEELSIWTLGNGQLVSKATAERKGYNEQVIFSPDAKTIAKGTMNGVDLYHFSLEAGLFLFASLKCEHSRRIAFSGDGRHIYVDTYYTAIDHFPRDKFNIFFLRGRVKRGMPTPLPSFTFQKKSSYIVPLRERESDELNRFLALPTNINVEKWEAYGNQIALGLHNGNLMIVHIPYDYM